MTAGSWLDAATLAQIGVATEPFATPSYIAQPERLLSWSTLAGVLAAIPDRETLVVSRGDLLALPVPRTLFALRAYLRDDIGLCLRHTEAHDESLAAIASLFTAHGVPQVQLFVTPGNSHGLRWHFDDEHVFIVQIEGRKDYYFRANTVANEVAHPRAFGKFTTETSPIMAATLVAGDILYLPSRWWHMAECAETSLSISVGIMPHSFVAATRR